MAETVRRNGLEGPPALDMITAYYLCHGLWTVIPSQLADNFKEMADMGFTAVALSFSESEMVYARRAFEIQVELAHRAGLKALVIPSRVGGRLAGAPLMPSLWLSQHPEAQVPGFHTFFGPIACLEHQPFREWLRQFMATLLSDYPLDGIIWDEPKCENVISWHPDTMARFGAEPTVRQMEDGYVDFLSELNAYCLAINPDLAITLFNQATSSEYFTRSATAIPGITYAGYDGNLARQSSFHEDPMWAKYRIESVWERTLSECAAAGRRTFALVENMLMPKEAIPEYEENLAAYLRGYRPDHLAFYYYAHNNEDPHRVHEITRRLMKEYL